MRMQPEPREFLRSPTEIDLGVEIVGDPGIVELHRNGRALLRNEDDVSDQERLVRI